MSLFTNHSINWGWLEADMLFRWVCLVFFTVFAQVSFVCLWVRGSWDWPWRGWRRRSCWTWSDPHCWSWYSLWRKVEASRLWTPYRSYYSHLLISVNRELVCQSKFNSVPKSTVVSCCLAVYRNSNGASKVLYHLYIRNHFSIMLHTTKSILNVSMLVHTAVPQPKNTFKKHLCIQIFDVY